MVTHPNFPSHLIDPSEKNSEWIKQYLKAAWRSYESDVPREIFYHAKYNYEVNRSYAFGNQSINKYKPLLGIPDDNKDGQAWLNIDWSVLKIIPKFRRIMLGKMNKIDYNIVATPIDSLANEQNEDYFANVKAKIMLREQAQQLGAEELLKSPVLQMTQDEAQDLEELEIQMNYTHKHQMSIEAEQGIKLILAQNNFEEIRQRVRECLHDYGVGGYKEWIDSNGAIKIRPVDPRNIIINRCSRPDFKDAVHIGEVIEMTISDLKQIAGSQFSEEQYEDIAKNYIGRLGNPREFPTNNSIYNRGYDKFRIRLLDMEFFSVNQMVYESRVDRRGNQVYARAGYDDRNKRKDKFERIAYKVVYKGKWIIDSEYIFDSGLCTDMKRAQSSLMDTEMSYHLRASEFHDMKAYGMLDQMIPIADAIQVAWYRLQNIINQARPKGIMIEMSTLENIPLGKGGKQLRPIDVIDMFNQTGTLIFRRTDLSGKVSSVKPIEELENGLGRDAMSYWQIIQNNIQLLRDITGMNELTDGSTPDPRTLTTTAKLAAEGSNNAFSPITNADRFLTEDLAKSLILRLQDVVKRSDVRGYVRGLGSNSLKFIRVSENVAMHEYGIVVEEKPTDEQKMRLLQQIEKAYANGMVDPEDSIIVESCDNIKVAQQILAYRWKKKQREADARAMQQQQMNGQIQQQSAMVAEQAKQQTVQIEAQVKAEIEQMKGKVQEQLLHIKYQYELELEKLRQGGKIEQTNVMTQSKQKEAAMKNGMLPEVEPQEESPMPDTFADQEESGDMIEEQS